MERTRIKNGLRRERNREKKILGRDKRNDQEQTKEETMKSNAETNKRNILYNDRKMKKLVFIILNPIKKYFNINYYNLL